MVRISSAKTRGEFDVHRPLIGSRTWGGGNFHIVCPMLSLDIAGKKVSSEEDVSQLLANLKISPGGGHMSDGSSSICVGQSDAQPNRFPADLPSQPNCSPADFFPSPDDFLSDNTDWSPGVSRSPLWER